MFLSRQKYTKESFLEEFFKTLTPWLIKRDEFINWNRIFNSLKKKEWFLSDLQNYNLKDIDILKTQIEETILSLDEPQKFIQDIFILLWNTRNFFVSDQDNVIFKEYSENIKNWNENLAKKLAEIIVEVWFKNVLEREKIEDYFVWLLVWFESDKRKNKWWKEFINYLRPLLEEIVNNIENLELIEEYKIDYEWENTTQSKKVDFAILKEWKCIVWIEINFYTNSGSKPTEIKRSYWEVNRKLNEKWIELMWITDWFGYNMMKKSLWDAFEIHKNTYNYKMVKKYFEKDLIEFIKITNA